MITIHDHTVHIAMDPWLLIFDKAVFLAAVRRGKAWKRAEAQQKREAAMAEAADAKRAQQGGLLS